jgi:lysosomal acid lipase/cholesteryl ester hydrolase
MIPFLGRLRPWEYLALLVSFILIGLEGFIRIVTLALPSPIINVFYRSSRRLFNAFSSPTSRKTRNTKKKIVTSIAQASDFVELCELFGYTAEEHIVQTKDGYLLGLHRLGWKKGEDVTVRVNSGKGSVQKKVVYLHHGLMMNSEVWVCLTEQERCLPFLLVDRGYDVWVRVRDQFPHKIDSDKRTARKQPWEQILQKICQCRVHRCQVLVILDRPVCLPRHS